MGAFQSKINEMGEFVSDKVNDLKSSSKKSAVALIDSASNEAKKAIGTDYTDNYGTVSTICFLSAILSRAAYFRINAFLEHICKVFGDNNIIPTLFLTLLNKGIVENGINAILNDELLFGPELQKEKPFGLNKITLEDNGGFSKQTIEILPLIKKINVLNGEEKKSESDPNCDYSFKIEPDENLFVTAISTTNYETVYVMADIRCPNIIWVLFTGTKDLQSASSWFRPSTAFPLHVNDINVGKDKFFLESNLIGIYKILLEMIHIIVDAVQDMATKLSNAGYKGDKFVLTTGHSLGGGLCTLFSLAWVLHITNKPNHRIMYPDLNENIGCFSLGCPRVFNIETAKVFCYLVFQNQDNVLKGDAEKTRLGLIEKNNIKGFITYLRLVTKNDLVTSMPLKASNFSHPCSTDKSDKSIVDKDPIERQNTAIEGLAQISNSASMRCVKQHRLAAKTAYTQPLAATNSLSKRVSMGKKDKELLGPFLMKNRISYHMMYFGVSFAGAVNLTKAFSFKHNIKPVRGDSKYKGDTVCRVVIFPSLSGDYKKVSVGFYDLKKKQRIGSVHLSDTDLNNENNSDATAVSVKKKSGFMKEMDRLRSTKEKQTVNEDVFDSKDSFNEIKKEMIEHDITNGHIEGQQIPTEYAELIETSNKVKDPSFGVSENTTSNITTTKSPQTIQPIINKKTPYIQPVFNANRQVQQVNKTGQDTKQQAVQQFNKLKERPEVQQALQQFDKLKSDPRVQQAKQQALQQFDKLKSDPRVQQAKQQALQQFDKLKSDPRVQQAKQQALQQFNKFKSDPSVQQAKQQALQQFNKFKSDPSVQQAKQQAVQQFNKFKSDPSVLQATTTLKSFLKKPVQQGGTRKHPAKNKKNKTRRILNNKIRNYKKKYTRKR